MFLVETIRRYFQELQMRRFMAREGITDVQIIFLMNQADIIRRADGIVGCAKQNEEDELTKCVSRYFEGLNPPQRIAVNLLADIKLIELLDNE